jgi:hypothetical protein
MALSRLYCSGDGDYVWCDVLYTQCKITRNVSVLLTRITSSTSKFLV